MDKGASRVMRSVVMGTVMGDKQPATATSLCTRYFPGGWAVTNKGGKVSACTGVNWEPDVPASRRSIVEWDQGERLEREVVVSSGFGAECISPLK